MKVLNTCFIALALLSTIITGCQKDDNFLVKEEAFSVIMSGFNGSTSELDITIDTMKLRFGISPSSNFNRTDKYTFPDDKKSVKLVVTEKETGALVYEQDVERGEYSVKVQLIYVGGKLVEKPVAPATNPEGFRLVSYLFLPRITGYTGDVDVVYYKKYENVVNGQLNMYKLEELARLTIKPYVFSSFLEAPVFPGGRNEIDGQVVFLNPVVKFFKAGTNIPYYEGGGVGVSQYANPPLPFSSKPEIIGVSEFGNPGVYLESFQTIQF